MTGAAAIPNLLTGARLVLGVAMWLCLAHIVGAVPFLPDLSGDGQFELLKVAFFLFVVAAITDFFDGLLARRWHVESVTGAILDPIADKILVAGAILGLMAMGGQTQDFSLFVVPAALILFREFAVSALREVAIGRGVRLPVTTLAKWKTTIQLIALGFELFAASWPAFGFSSDPADYMPVITVAHGLMWIAAAVTLWTGVEYWLAARRALRDQPADRTSAA